jgi:hypothetical protein
MSVILGSRTSTETPLRFRLCLRSGVWHLTEEKTGSIGGVFCSVGAALAFVQAESRHAIVELAA